MADNKKENDFEGFSTSALDIMQGPAAMSNCSSPVSATRFLGSTVKSFSSKIGWGQSSSECTIELVDDTGVAARGNKVEYDSLGLGQPSVVTSADKGYSNPPIGKPQYFSMGSFTFNGLLQSWESSVSMDGCTHTARLVSPTVVLSNAVLIFKGLDDFDTKGSNFINVHKLLEKESWCTEGGVTWSDIANAVKKNGAITFRGQDYSLGWLGGLGPSDFRFTGDSIDLMGAIDKIVKASGSRVHVKLAGSSNIKVSKESMSGGAGRASVINTTGADVTATRSLELGGISNTVAIPKTGCCGDGSFMSATSGLEAAEVTSQAVTQGEFEHRYWQIEREDDEAEGEGEGSGEGEAKDDKDEDKATFEYWFGVDPETKDRIVPELTDEGPGDAEGDEWVDGVKFKVNTKSETFGDIIEEYEIHSVEIRAAMEGYDNWYEYMAWFRTDILEDFGIDVERGMGNSFLPTALVQVIDDGDDSDAQEFKNTSKSYMESRMKQEDKDEPIRALFEFVSQFGSFYGQKYYVELPALACCKSQVSADTTITSYEQTDGGYPLEDMKKILDLSFGHNGSASDVGLEPFRTEDGRIGPILQYLEGDKPPKTEIDVSKLSGEWYKKEDKYWVAATFEQIHVEECEDGELEGGVVLGTGGGVRPIPEEGESGPVKGLSGALMKIICKDAAKGGGSFDEDKFKTYLEGRGGGGNSLRGLGLAPRAMLPKKAGVPLKSNKLCYGGGEEGEDKSRDPWKAVAGDHGKAEFEQNTSLSPWNFGGYHKMFQAGEALTYPKVSSVDVINQGSRKISGMGGGSLGGSIDGAPITSINFNIGMGGITTTVQYRTFIRNFGDLAQNRVEFMELQAKSMQSFQRAFNLNQVEKKNKETVKQAANGGKGGGGGGQGGGGGNGNAGGKVANNSGAKKTSRDNFQSGTDGGYIVSSNVFYPQKALDEAYALSGYGTSSGGDWPSEGLKTSGVIGSLENTASSLSKPERWTGMGGGSMDILFRPFTIGAAEKLAEYSKDGVGDCCPSPADFNGGIQKCCSPSPCPISITSKTMNPFMEKATAESLAEKADWKNGHDMTNLISGSEMGEKGIRMEDSASDVRPMGIRGPVVIVGWGYDTKGYPVPNKGGDGGTDCKFLDDWLVKPDKWKAGPLDVVWDDGKKMWVPNCHHKDAILFGKLKGDLDPGGTSEADIESGGDTETVTVTNRMGQPLCKGQNVFLYYNSHACEYVVIQAQFMPVCVVTDLRASASSDPDCLDLKATTRIIYTQTPPTVGVESRWANVKACASPGT